MSQRELAKALGLSPGGLNYFLQALLHKGAVKAQLSKQPEQDGIRLPTDADVPIRKSSSDQTLFKTENGRI